MQVVIESLGTLRRWAQKLGPYVVIEILLPGGTLFALLFFLYQRKKFNVGALLSSWFA